MTTRQVRLGKAYPLVLAGGLGGLVVVLVLGRLLSGPGEEPTVTFTLGYIAAWVAIFGMRVAWWALPAAVILGSAVLAEGGTLLVAALCALVAVALGAALGALMLGLGVTMSRPVDPILIAFASLLAALVQGLFHVTTGATGYPGGSAFGATWTAATMGSILILTLVLSYRPGRAMRHGSEFSVLAALAVVVAVAVVPFIHDWYAQAEVGVIAWFALPLLLVIGWRYGVFAAALAVWLLAALAIYASLGLSAPTESELVKRQFVGILLVVVSLSVVLLLQRQNRALARLKAQERVTTAFLGNVEPIWYVKAFDGRFWRYMNLGGGPYRNRTDVAGVTDDDLYGAQIAADIATADHAVLETGEGMVNTEVLPMPDGTVRTTLSDRFPIRDENGILIGIGGLRTDISDRASQEQAEQEQAALLQAMFERSPVPTLRVRVGPDHQIRIAAANEAFARVTGRTVADLVAAPMSDLVPAADWPRVTGLFDRPRDSQRWSPQTEVALHTRIGQDRKALVTATPLPVDGADTIPEFLVHLEDVTARRAAEDAVAWYSIFDAGTGLLNRVALGDRLDAALHRLGADAVGVALIVLDVDEFKAVNDNHGHRVGDHILSEFADRIRTCVGSGEAVARLGADEFAVLLEGASSESVAVLVGRLQQVLSAPVGVVDESIAMSVSFGAVVTVEAEMTAGELVRQAELALFRAKSGGRGRVEFYRESMRLQAQAVLNVRTELNRAVLTDAFAVAYQPIVDLGDSSVCGYEALVRLPAKDGRLLVPGEFLDVARAADLVTQMDRLVFLRALADQAAGLLPVAGVGLSVNVEPDDLRDGDLALSILTQLHARSMDPRLLTVEVTEAALLDNHPAVIANLASLRDAGISIAIDDFGTGYSSLGQLRRLNADVIKIDRSFVMGMDEDPEAANIVATVINLAHRLDLIAVAEGIESRSQAETLRRMGCDRGQGYLFGRPEVPTLTAPAAPGIPEQGSGTHRRFSQEPR